MNIRDVLAELGHQMGLNVTLNEEGVCRLVFDDRFSVDIEVGPDNATVHLYSVLCPIPPENKESFYEWLLEANLFGGDTGGAWFALDGAHGEVVLNRTLKMANTDYRDFADLLEAFVNHLEAWTDKLAGGELNESTDAPAAARAANDAMSGFIRA
ncbi:MAG: type III secretion system chaperone [Candidatus Competibacteraceae bacterium]|nr:type III secretion system chaperone [Candidatus Competibacteraceae bacterium]MBK9953524.1 type III secretion system chaperone [Candidatus Competibacteraceae bacterium]